jgi:uncharacterized membrane protein
VSRRIHSVARWLVAAVACTTVLAVVGMHFLLEKGRAIYNGQDITPARMQAQAPLFAYYESIYVPCFVGALIGAIACLCLLVAWFDAWAERRQAASRAPGFELIQ